VLVLLVGGAVLRISLSDVYLRYVKEGLRPFLIVAGVLLVLIAVATLWREVFRREPSGEGPAGEAALEAHLDGHDEDARPAARDGDPSSGAAGSGDGHGHAHGGPRVAWLLVLPVLAIFLVAPPALGSYSASRSNATVTPQSDFPPLPSGDPVAMPVLEYASRAIWDGSGSLDGRTVRLTGFVTPRPEGGVYLTRIVLSCCAADGRPVKVALFGDAVPPGLAADSWVTVTGRYRASEERDPVTADRVAALEAVQVQPVAAPRQPYE